MSYPRCPQCGWDMTEDVEVSRAARSGLDKPIAIWRCSDPDCGHTEEQ